MDFCSFILIIASLIASDHISVMTYNPFVFQLNGLLALVQVLTDRTFPGIHLESLCLIFKTRTSEPTGGTPNAFVWCLLSKSWTILSCCSNNRSCWSELELH